MPLIPGAVWKSGTGSKLPREWIYIHRDASANQYSFPTSKSYPAPVKFGVDFVRWGAETRRGTVAFAPTTPATSWNDWSAFSFARYMSFLLAGTPNYLGVDSDLSPRATAIR